jgi:DNA polymerase IV
MIACVMIPYFATLVQQQTDPALAGIPLLLIKYGAKRSKVMAVSAEAAALGAVAGMSLSRARGTCPTAHLVSFHEQTMQQACDRLLETLWEYTNRVEVDETAYPQTGVFYLDLGMLREADARYLGEHLQKAVSEQVRAEVSVGLGSGKFPAYLAAYGQPGKVTLVPRYEEAAFVAPFPASLLPMSRDTARRLSILWLREIGQLAALPREAVISQFGREGKLLYGLALGLDGRPVKPRKMPKSETVSRQFDHAIRERNRLDVVLHHLAEDLSQRSNVVQHRDRIRAWANDSTTH